MKVVIVGAGHAGANVAAFLRQMGFEGSIDLIGAEPQSPYHRPPLSKKFTADEAEQSLKAPSHYADQGIDLRTGTRVSAIDPLRRELRCADGRMVAYDALVIATGARNRRLEVPGGELDGIHQLRTIADARALKAQTRPGTRLVIVGGGYIGLEVAAAATREGVVATVLEREERILPRVGSPELSEYLTRLHRRQGTGLRTAAQVAAFEDDGSGRVAAAVLTDGSRIPCDCVLVGIGAVPDDDLARAAGIRCDGGIIVDQRGATDRPGIWAAGDVTRRPVAGLAGLRRLESIPSAIEQARAIAAAITGADEPPPEVPWFWSDQFELKLQICGLLEEDSEPIVRGDRDAGRFAIFHVRAGRVIAVEAVNAPGDFMAAKRLIREGAALDLDRLRDGSLSLREAVAA